MVHFYSVLLLVVLAWLATYLCGRRASYVHSPWSVLSLARVMVGRLETLAFVSVERGTGTVPTSTLRAAYTNAIHC